MMSYISVANTTARFKVYFGSGKIILKEAERLIKLLLLTTEMGKEK